MSNEHRNGSSGIAEHARAREEADQQLAAREKAGRRYRRLRAYLDTLCEVDRSAHGVEGLDRGRALRAYADAVDESLSVWASSAALARAEAMDLERGARTLYAASDETSETRRTKRNEDSSPGKKRA